MTVCTSEFSQSSTICDVWCNLKLNLHNESGRVPFLSFLASCWDLAGCTSAIFPAKSPRTNCLANVQTRPSNSSQFPSTFLTWPYYDRNLCKFKQKKKTQVFKKLYPNFDHLWHFVIFSVKRMLCNKSREQSFLLADFLFVIWFDQRENFKVRSDRLMLIVSLYKKQTGGLDGNSTCWISDWNDFVNEKKKKASRFLGLEVWITC